MKIHVVVGLCSLAAVGCAAKLEAKGDEVTRREGDVISSGKFESTVLADDVVETLVDATAECDWQRFDFDTGEAVNEEQGWDLAFCRFRVISNGGVTGDGGVELARLESKDFEDVTAAPSDGFEADREDGEDGNMDPDNTLNMSGMSWYDYELEHHELSPHDATFVVRSSEQRYFKLRFEDYYDAAGTPAWVKFRWAEIDAP